MFSKMVSSKDKKLEAQIEGMQVLARKLEPFLPRLTPVVLHRYSSTEKLLLESLLFRAMRFSVIPGNEVVLSQCISAIPSHFYIPERIELKDPYVFTPLVGQILSCLWQVRDSDIITETLGNSLRQLNILSEHDHLIFATRLRLDFSLSQASYMQHPYKVDYTNLSSQTSVFNFTFDITKAEF